MKHKIYNDEAFLIDALRRGRQSAFEYIFMNYYRVLCAQAARLVGTEEMEDVVQDCLVWLWTHRETVVIDRSLKHYLFTLVYHRSINVIKRRDLAADITGQILRAGFESEPTPADVYSEAELRRRIYAALTALPETYREAFLLHRYDGLSYKEIGEKLGVSPKTVAYRIGQSLKLLRGSLGDYLPLWALFILLDYQQAV